MHPLAHTLLTNLAVLLIAMLALWVVSVAKRDASIIDPFWGIGFVVVAWTSALLNGAMEWRALLLSGLTTMWGLRLSVFLLWRNWNHSEDRRYAAMRNSYGHRFWWVSLFTVFLLQGVILWFVSLPLQVALAKNIQAPFGYLDAAGIVAWIVGITFEAVGDWQLARFKSSPGNVNGVMDRGLWRFTRHPNYFGDFCVWWGLYLVSTAGGAAWTIVSPIVMSLLLMRVSGVTLTEKTIGDRRPEYAEYKSRTNAFFPGPRRSARSH